MLAFRDFDKTSHYDKEPYVSIISLLRMISISINYWVIELCLIQLFAPTVFLGIMILIKTVLSNDSHLSLLRAKIQVNESPIIMKSDFRFRACIHNPIVKNLTLHLNWSIRISFDSFQTWNSSLILRNLNGILKDRSLRYQLNALRKIVIFSKSRTLAKFMSFLIFLTWKISKKNP